MLTAFLFNSLFNLDNQHKRGFKPNLVVTVYLKYTVFNNSQF